MHVVLLLTYQLPTMKYYNVGWSDTQPHNTKRIPNKRHFNVMDITKPLYTLLHTAYTRIHKCKSKSTYVC